MNGLLWAGGNLVGWRHFWNSRQSRGPYETGNLWMGGVRSVSGQATKWHGQYSISATLQHSRWCFGLTRERELRGMISDCAQ
jgi:hypothetical protein